MSLTACPAHAEHTQSNVLDAATPEAAGRSLLSQREQDSVTTLLPLWVFR